ncbi:type II 3-dehydroquinate dehydratase [Actinoplanes sichuanensis]|uniref:3-dehydroquinate dehydratase n=1 Tax=Actinoplanes sichuanensis TaxID=512349 RepID=A0ABW4A3N4_9ACTN|nr:type II 3-dehydroquinate dehydratase [Actinoplanes sichuanensis]BEL05863.1 type II 3-dehydroquinate dehydratase [Actinoplanes sichuanensis]
MRRLSILNGPNLNMLGRREPDLYGRVTLAQIETRCRALAGEMDFELFFGQSNAEAQLIDWVHQAVDGDAAVIINPAGFTTRSVALYDALRMVRQPVVEVHLTNVFAREPLYRRLLTAAAATGLLAGFGAEVYELAMRGLAGRVWCEPGSSAAAESHVTM